MASKWERRVTWELAQPVAPETTGRIVKLCEEWQDFITRLKKRLGLGEGIVPLTCTELLRHVYASKRDAADDGLRAAIAGLCGGEKPKVQDLSRWLGAIHGFGGKALQHGSRKWEMVRIISHNTTRWFPSDEALRRRETKRGRRILEAMAKRGEIYMEPPGPETDPKRSRAIRTDLRSLVRQHGVAKMTRLTGAGRAQVKGWRDDVLSRPITKHDVDCHIAVHWSLDGAKALQQLLGEHTDLETLAGLLGVRKETVGEWQLTGEVPADRKLELERLLDRERGIVRESPELDLEEGNEALEGVEVSPWFEG